ncbi:MAG: NAD-dependent epimerase/dehydratase family protein [Bacteroidetes bacterium]|nr:NAD-dependent epimerase/dehydratase family protein [Bacteroidota bacterium]
MNKILVLGSEGFIGSHVIQKGLEKGYQVYGCDIVKHSNINYNFFSISVDSVAFSDLLAEVSFCCIINCAGSGNVAFSLENPKQDFQMNVNNVIYILEAIKKYQKSTKYIHISSAAVYGNPEILPVKETTLISPISPYGFHKFQSEILCKEYSKLYGINICIVRPFSVYGPGLRKQIIWDTYQKGKKAKIIELAGTGYETRDFIYIEDLTECLFHIAIFKHESLEILNVATGNEICIKTFLHKLLYHLGWKHDLLFNQSLREGDPNFWKADISKLTSLGFHCKYSIDLGLSETANWLKNEA